MLLLIHGVQYALKLKLKPFCFHHTQKYILCIPLFFKACTISSSSWSILHIMKHIVKALKSVLFLGFYKRGPKGPPKCQKAPHPHPLCKRKPFSLTQYLKTNTCVYACIHCVGTFKIHVSSVDFRNTDTTRQSVNKYCTPVYKEVGHLKSKIRQRFANHKVWDFFKPVEPTLKCPTKHPQPPDHHPPLTPPLSRSFLPKLFFCFFKIN